MTTDQPALAATQVLTAGVALVVLAVVVLADLVAALPARLAAQTRPAAALRLE